MCLNTTKPIGLDGLVSLRLDQCPLSFLVFPSWACLSPPPASAPKQESWAWTSGLACCISSSSNPPVFTAILWDNNILSCDYIGPWPINMGDFLGFHGDRIGYMPNNMMDGFLWKKGDSLWKIHWLIALTWGPRGYTSFSDTSTSADVFWSLTQQFAGWPFENLSNIAQVITSPGISHLKRRLATKLTWSSHIASH